MESQTETCVRRWACQWRQANGNENKSCPLHDPGPEKDLGQFVSALSEIARFWVPGGLPFQLYGVIFPASISKDLFAHLGNGRFELKLQSAKFYGPINFEGKTFQKVVDFDGATFEEIASFQYAQFNKRASFVGATFQRDAVFAGAVFEDPVYFDQMKCERADFALAQFKAMASFRGKPDQIIFDGVKEVIFDEARFFKPDLVRLSYADFSRCSLLNTDLRGIDFSGVRWGEKGRWAKHAVLYSREPEKEVRIELESAYRQIRQSYEDRRDYGRAGAFYFGEMEQRWRESGGFLATLYRWSSSYGHNPAQAFIVLLLLLVFDAGLVASCGLKPTAGTAYNLVEGTEGMLWGSIQDWWHAFWFHVVKVVTFNQPAVVPKLPLGDVISTLMRIVISVQVALFVLAVNRKFKR
jgi:Pentapeptide repeats (9 copies)/Pentapeptide repeats (8 copies)